MELAEGLTLEQVEKVIDDAVAAHFGGQSQPPAQAEASPPPMPTPAQLATMTTSDKILWGLSQSRTIASLPRVGQLALPAQPETSPAPVPTLAELAKMTAGDKILLGLKNSRRNFGR
jgi:hypothetical protein